MISLRARTIATPPSSSQPRTLIFPPIKIPFYFNKIPFLHLETPLIINKRPSSSLSSSYSSSFSSSSITMQQSSSSVMLTSGASGRINALFSIRALKSLLIFINAVVLFILLPFRGRRRSTVVPSGSSTEKPRDFEKLHECGPHRKGPAMVRVPTKIVPWKSSASSGGGGAVVADQELAARRALAARRVLEDDDANSIREFSMFVTARGDTIFTQLWTPVSVKIRGLVVVMHGLNEHSGRYSDFAKQLNSHGFKVYGMDWIGIGISIGAKK